MSYIAKGQIAWQIPDRINLLYEVGAYVPAAGWCIIPEIPGNSYRGPHGQYIIPQGVFNLQGARSARQNDVLSLTRNILRKNRNKAGVQLSLI